MPPHPIQQLKEEGKAPRHWNQYVTLTGLKCSKGEIKYACLIKLPTISVVLPVSVRQAPWKLHHIPPFIPAYLSVSPLCRRSLPEDRSLHWYPYTGGRCVRRALTLRLWLLTLTLTLKVWSSLPASKKYICSFTIPACLTSPKSALGSSSPESSAWPKSVWKGPAYRNLSNLSPPYYALQELAQPGLAWLDLTLLLASQAFEHFNAYPRYALFAQ